MVCASTYSAATQADDDTTTDCASTASPSSVSAATTSPSAFLSMSDHAFTPLSMVGSDLSYPDDSDDGFFQFRHQTHNKPSRFIARLENPAARTSPSPNGTSTATDMGRNAAVTSPQLQLLKSSESTPGTARPTANSIVGTLVHSLEQHCHAPQKGYEPLAVVPAKNGQHDDGRQGHHHSSASPFSYTSSSSFWTSPHPAENAEGNVKSFSGDHREETRRQRESPQSAPHTILGLNRQATPGSPLFITNNSSRTDVHVDISIESLQQVARTVSSSSISAPLVRPKPRHLPSASQPASRSASVRTVSDASVASWHPSPYPNARSSSCSGSVATLEATAERFTATPSIDEAIRKAHDELKRTDSRRSSILRACNGRTESDNETSALQTLQAQLAAISRQNSIVGTNSAARVGGYSPAAYVMSPTNSIKNGSGRFRSVSKASSLGVPSASSNVDTFDLSEAGNAERFPSFLSRHGPGQNSIRSVVSSKHSLVDIAETEPPMTLTLDALDEADRAAEAGEEWEDEDTIRAIAHQHVEGDPIEDVDDADDMETPQAEALMPMLDHDFLRLPTPGALQIHQPESFDNYGTSERGQARPSSAGSGTTYERNAFGDFDGVHCDPDTADFGEPAESDVPPPPRQQRRLSRPLSSLPPRPQSYFDMETGQQMLYYPARVPAMLNLPPKLAKSKRPDRQKVRSQVLSVMPTESRDSRVWLPDPIGERSEPLMSGAVGGAFVPRESSPSRASFVADSEPALSASGSFHGLSAQEANAAMSPKKQERVIKRPQRLTDKRKSQLPGAVEELPSQLRASVFFDLPEEPPKIVVKDHSAMATLDSILDASASAPVSAFIDHAFAGTLGSEVYGIDKKKRRKSNADFGLPHKRSESSLAVLRAQDDKKRGSFLSLLAPTRKSSENLLADRRSTSLGALPPSPGGSSKDGNSPNVDQGPFSPSLMDPDSDEEPDKEGRQKEADEEDESSEDDLENVYQGRPTTLLAELQIRKQRNKMRTRPVHKVYPNGLHSTLLELDTVAEVERSMRKGKKVNLAWEDPNANPDLMEEQDDEEVPLAMLAAARAAAASKGVNKSTLDVGVIMDEVNRPLGLMERRELEENEPLSRRRDRIQGRAPRETLNLETMQKRMTQLSMAHGGAGLRSQSRLALPLHSPSYGAAGSAAASIRSAEPQPEPEVEGETLAQRRKRLQGDSLPTARAVSGSFSLELLKRFGGEEEQDKGKGKETAPAARQEEETLGQRRRRLQAEREAREREMAVRPTGEPHRLLRRMSMADILTAHPLEPPQGVVNPRELERQRAEAAAAQKQRDHDFRLAAMRGTQVVPPQALPYAAGVGLGTSGGRGMAYGGAYGVPPPLQRMSTMPAGYGGNVQPQQQQQFVPPMYGGAMTMAGVDGPYGMGYHHQGGFGFPPTQAPVEMVERWRQSIIRP